MPDVLIESIKEGSRKSGKGEMLTGIHVVGTRLVDDYNAEEEPWDKFYYDFTDEPMMFDGFNPGDAVKIRNTKDGKFWKLAGVELLKGGGGGSTRQERHADPSPDTPQPTPLVEGRTPVASDMVMGQAPLSTDQNWDERMRFRALETAVSFMGVIGDHYKKTSKLDFMESELMRLADKFNAFITAGPNPIAIESNPENLSGKTTEQEEPNLPSMPGDEEEDDQIPF